MQTIEEQLEADADEVVAMMIRANSAVIAHMIGSPDFAHRPRATREQRLHDAIASSQASLKYAILLQEAHRRELDALAALLGHKDLAPGQTYEHQGWRVSLGEDGPEVAPMPILAAMPEREVNARTDEQLDRLGIDRLKAMIGVSTQVADSGQVPAQNGAAPVDPTAPG